MKKNIPLLVGILLPIVFIIILSVVVFLPMHSVNPAHNFLYASNSYSYRNDENGQTRMNNFIIQNGKLFRNTPSASPLEQNQNIKYIDPELYMYDVKTDTIRKTTFEEAEKYVYEDSRTSSDGYTVQYDYNNAGIFELFGARSNPGYVVSNGKSQKRLKSMMAENQYYYSLALIGWIK